MMGREKRLLAQICHQIATRPAPQKLPIFFSPYQENQNVYFFKKFICNISSCNNQLFGKKTFIQPNIASIINQQDFSRNLYLLRPSLSNISLRDYFIRNFHHLQPNRHHISNNSFILCQKKSQSGLLNSFPRNFWFSGRNDKPSKKEKRKKKIPKLILLQNPFTWLMIKIDFNVLRRIWDPTFREKEFKFGTKQAISRVTQVISDGQLNDLNGLLTKAARMSLLRDLDRNWNHNQRSLLALGRDDIQISAPRKVYFIRIADKKFCDVDMAFLALKWAPINSIEALIFTEIFARFHREYTPHSIPEWTIAFFKVTRFEILRQQK